MRKTFSAIAVAAVATFLFVHPAAIREHGHLSVTDTDDWAGAPAGPGSLTITGGAVAGSNMVVTFTQTGRLTSVVGELKTSGVAGSRSTAIEVVDASNNLIWLFPYLNTQAPNTTERYETYAGVSAQDVSQPSGFSYHFVPLPNGLIVSSGWQLVTLTTNLDVGDKWDFFNVNVANS